MKKNKREMKMTRMKGDCHQMKKTGAILLAIMMIALAGLAYADASLTDGKAGEFTDYDAGNASTTGDNSKTAADTTVIIKKQLISVNANGTTVKAPAFAYTYTVTPADVSGNPSITDSASKHASGTAVQAPVKAGITTGLVVTGTSAGTAGTAASAVGTLAFTNTTELTSSSDGAVNSYDIKLNFAGVTFTQPGVYRYLITETLANSATYDGIAVQDGGSNERYLDVYVDGAGTIYGYVCIDANSSITSGTDDTKKTNGFVEDTNHTGENKSGADYYYTYDLTLSKDVVNDNYAESNTAFPFTVFFKNSAGYTTTYTITETAGTGSTGISPAAASAPAWRGVARVKDGGAITYTGIPCGVDVDVYETNVASGVTYTVTTSVNGGTAVQDNNVTSSSAPATAVEQGSSRAAYESTKANVDTTLNTAVTATQTVAVTNTLQLISPTGYVVRYAPYALMLLAGIALLVIVMKHRKNREDED